MRARGTGSITPHQGGFWARLPVDGRMKSLGVHATYEEAEIVLNQALIARAKTPGSGGMVLTFAAFGRRVLDMREEEGIRSIASERRRFKHHLEACAIADKPVADVSPADIDLLMKSIAKKNAADKRGKRKVSRKTVQRCFALVSAIFSVAVVREMRPTNPCAGVKLRRGKDEEVDEDGDQVWDWLRGEEQQAVLACEKIPRWFRVMIRAAWGIGWRQGEQWNHELRDLHFAVKDDRCACGTLKCVTLKEKGPCVYIRWGSRGKPPKSGRRRFVNLFGEGLAAMREWLEILPAYAPKNPLRLTFPTVTGCRRQPGAPERSVRSRDADGKSKVGKVELLDEALKAAGVARHIRWHDLRHTCASSLVSGTWGRRWALIQVCRMLGHSSITVTEKYAHLCEDALREEADATPGHVTARVTGNSVGGSGMAAISNESGPVGWVGNDPTTYGLKGPEDHELKQGFRSENHTSVTREAQERSQRILKLVAEGRGKEALALAVTAALEVAEPDLGGSGLTGLKLG